MKKTFIALALLASVAAHATTLTVEYDRDRVAHTANEQTVWVGLKQSTPVGVFDGKLQRALPSSLAGHQTGWELGYSLPVTVGSLTLQPRLGVGSAFYQNPAYAVNARYVRPGIEARLPLVGSLGGYASYDYTKGINSVANVHTQRVQAGVDYAVTPSFGVRAGLSHKNDGAQRTNGVVLVGSYSF